MVRFPADWAEWDVALAHDWLTGMRGGERVLEWLCRGFPRATIHTLIHNPAAVSGVINAHPVRTSPLQRFPGVFRRYRYLLPLFPAAAAALRPRARQMLVSTSHCVAKAVRAAPGARHLCYCFTPMRYAWSFHDEYFGTHPVRRAAVAPLLGALRRWDRRTAARVDRFVTTSGHVRERIRRSYGRDADVVHPPVDLDFFTPGPAPAPGAYDLVVSALVPYKRVDLAVRAYARSGFPLRVAGVGTEAARLRALAGPSVEFLGWQSDEALRELYRGCRCVVFPGEEDFGIVPLEAQACGRPVVALGRGGATETVVPAETGVLFARQTEEALLAAVAECAARAWDAGALRRQAARFGPQAFVDGLDAALRRCLAG